MTSQERLTSIVLIFMFRAPLWTSKLLSERLGEFICIIFLNLFAEAQESYKNQRIEADDMTVYQYLENHINGLELESEGMRFRSLV